MDVVFLLDAGSAVDAGAWNQTQTAVRQAVGQLSPSFYGTRVSVVTFNDRVHITQRLRSTAVTRFDFGGRSPDVNSSRNLGTALRDVRRLVFVGPDDRVDVPDVLVVLLAAASASRDDAVDAASRLKFDGVKVVAVGLTLEVDAEELTAIATNAGEAKSLMFRDAGQLLAATSTLMRCICHIKSEGKVP